MSSGIEVISQKLIGRGQTAVAEQQSALKTATGLWAEATTAATTQRRDEVMHDKVAAVTGFFAFIKKHPAAVRSQDVQAWRVKLEADHLKPATVYGRISRLSSFYTWVMKNTQLAAAISANPVILARPKAPRAFQGESTKALTDEQIQCLVAVVKKKADAGSVVAKRDYALLQWYVKTGRKRNEVISLRGSDVQLRNLARDGAKEEVLIVRYRIKGGRYLTTELRDATVRAALFDYLGACDRLEVLRSERSLWTRHDRAGRPGAPLTSHAFVKNLKRYAKEAGLEHIHNHMTRHTFARMVNEETGSLVETQEALDHEDLATTRICLESIAIKRD